MADIIKDALEEFEDARSIHADIRDAALDDIKFARLGEQWDDKDVQNRRREGRPCLTINRLPSFIRQVTNEARMNKPAIKVKPVDSGADPETADIFNGIIRNIEYSSNADVAYENGLDSAVGSSFGFFQVVTEYAHDDAFSQDIRIKPIFNPLAVEWDPYSEEPDGSDWGFCFVLDFVQKDKAVKQFGKKVGTGFSPVGIDSGAYGRTSEDMICLARRWVATDVERTLVMFSNGTVMAEEDALKPHPDTGIPMMEMYADLGILPLKTRKSTTRKVKSYLLGGDVIEEADWPGRWIPVVPVFGEMINVEGKLHLKSLVRDAKDPQRMFNYWRTATTELVALAPKAPYIAPKGAFKSDADKWQTANVKSHPYLEYDGGTMPQRQPFAGVPAGALQEALNASDDMKSIMGIYDASLGARSNETSGKAILARQREGDTSTFHFLDNQARSIRHCGRILVDLIPKIYDKPQVMRIIGSDGSTDSIRINEEFQDPKSGISRIYDLTAGKYDVAVDTGPSFTTRREEFVTSVTEIIRANPALGPLVMDLVAKNMDWPEADEIAKRLKVMLPKPIQDMESKEGLPPEAQVIVTQLQQQLQQMQQQMQMGLQEFKKVQGENEELKLQLQNKTGELQIRAGELQLKAQEISSGDGDSSMLDLQLKQEEAQIKREEIAIEAELKRYEIDQRIAADIYIANLKASESSAANVQPPVPEQEDQDVMASVMAGIEALRQEIAAQKEASDGGRIVAIRRVTSPDGRLIGGVQIRADGTETPVQIQ